MTDLRNLPETNGSGRPVADCGTARKGVEDIAKMEDIDKAARRDTMLLSVCAAFGTSAASIVILSGSLVGASLLGDDKSLATLPVSAFVGGTALGTIPAGRLARRFGRKPAFLLANLVNALACASAALAIIAGSFGGFCLCVLVMGMMAAFHHQYRFAATDQASPAFQPRAVSWVLAGGLFAGIIGPQTAIFTRDIMPASLFAGTYLALGALQMAGFATLLATRLRAAPSRTGSARAVPPPPPPQMRAPGYLAQFEFAPRQRLVVALVCAPLCYAIMSFVMTAAPLAMHGHGHSHTDSALAIQWHVIAMFAPSFFTGHLIGRFGAPFIMSTGFVLLALASIVALGSQGIAGFWLSLIALGMGWNFAFVTSTVTLARVKTGDAVIQSYNDFLVFSIVAAASLLSGVFLHIFGWQLLNTATLPLIALCLGLIFQSSLRQAPTKAL